MNTSEHSAPNCPVAWPILVAVFAFAALTAQAGYFYHGSYDATSQSSTRYSWSDSSHWTPNAVPGTDDSVDWYPTKTSSHRIGYFSLDDSYSVGYITNKWRSIDLAKDSSVDGTVTFTVAHVLGNSGYQHHVIGGGVTLVVPAAARLLWGTSDGTYSDLTLENGSSAQILGAVETQMTEYKVKSGSTLLFNPVSYTLKNQEAGDSLDKFTVQGGSVNFPSGLAVASDSNSKANSQQLNQESGVVTFGGDFTSEAPWTYTFSGGTLAVTDNSAFGQNIALTIPASASVTLDVASDKTFSAANFAADSMAAITKTGAGTFAYAPTTASIAVNAGGIGFASAATYDLFHVTFASGTRIALNALGATISATSPTIGNATFVASLPSAAGNVLNVSDSSLSDLLAKAQSELTAPAGYALVISGTALNLEKDTGSANTFSATGDLLSAECWGGGSVPGDDSEVSISGDGIVATYSAGTIPSWTSITVKNGATLRISANATLPPVILNMSARLEITDGATMTLANASDLSGIATAQQIPVLSIASGATLSVPGGMQFSNVDIDLRGTLAVSPAGTITFGYAAAGETTYIGFNSVGGKITNSVLWNYDLCRIGMCCPEQGGTVVAPEPLVFKDMPVTGEYLPTYSDNYWNGFSLGVNNPENIAFEVVFDNTKWNASGNLYVKGGATFRLKNGSMYMNDETYSLYNRHAEISGNGRIVIESDSVLRLDAMGNSGNTATVINATTPGHDSIIVSGGGMYDNYRTTGNGNGIFVASNAVITVHVPFIDEDVSGSSGTTHYCNTNILFEGFSSVSLATNSTLTLTTRNSGSSVSHFSDASGDRVVALADVPITGAGSIALSNDNVNVFGVIVKNGANTATGTASVIPPADGKGATTLYFADGANWAGTVTAGNVALTNLVDGAAAATNAFGTLDLAAGGTFPVRVWKSGGAIVAHDGLDVAAYATHGGRIAFDVRGEDMLLGEGFTLGAIGAESPLPALVRPWVAKRRDGRLYVSISSGLSIILR